MSVVLWPRQEVLQLVIPQFATVGRTLNANTAINLIRRLSKHQTDDGKISFYNWLRVAKEILRWNDNCIHLFWDMLSLGTYYLSRESALHCSREEVSINLENIAIFLVMHIHDVGTPSTNTKSPSSVFDTHWPASLPVGAAAVMADENEGTAFTLSTSSTSPATSPKKESSVKKLTTVNAPPSPRSPKGGSGGGSFAAGSPSNSPTPQSPKRSAAMSPTAVNPGSPTSSRTPRTSAQYLHSVRQKLPIILRALGSEEEDLIAASAELNLDNDTESRDESQEFKVSKKIFDSLALIVCGGYSRDQTVASLSSLHPLWGGYESGTDAAFRSSRDPMDTIGPALHTAAVSGTNENGLFVDDDEKNIPFSELISWLGMHLSMNDVLYPVTGSGSSGFTNSNTLMSPSTTSSSAAGASTAPNHTLDGEAQIAALAAQNKAQHPIRSFAPITTLNRSNPLVLNGCCTTMMHIVTNASSRTSSFRKSSRSNISMSSASFDNLHGHNVTTLNTVRNSGSGSAMNVLDASNDSVDLSEINQQHQHLGLRSAMNESFSPSNSFTSPQMLSPRNPHSPSVQFKHGVGDTSSENHHHHHQHGVLHIDNLTEAELAKTDLSLDSRFKDMLEFGMTHQNTFSRPDQMLPQLFLNYSSKAKIYLISPFYSASINYCLDSDIMVGAVFGALIVSNCERISLTCTCRKLIINNCVDCAFNVATLTTTIIAGESKGLVIGPYNTAYRNLKNHLKIAALHPLLSMEAPSANAETNHNSSGINLLSALESKGSGAVEAGGLQEDAQTHQSPNCWAQLCDVNACLEAPASDTNTGSNSNMNQSDEDAPLLPPLPSKARLLHYEEFHPVTVPYRAEVLAFDQGPIRTPTEYMESLEQQLEGIVQIKAQLASMMNSTVERKILNASGDDDERKRRYNSITNSASAAISKKFMEWLVNSGNAKQVMDLVRLDAERFTIPHHIQHQTHGHHFGGAGQKPQVSP